MLTKLPAGGGFGSIISQAAQATSQAIKQGVKQLEVDFPPVQGKLDVSLGEFSDANLKFAGQIARSLGTGMGGALWIVLPDAGEAARAKKSLGKSPFRITFLEEALKEGGECKAQICVGFGFSIDEWIKMESLFEAGGKAPMVALNCGLDKVRGSYYPKFFYPGLYKARERFLSDFEPVYYLKPLPQGWIFRKYPEDWQVQGSQGGGPYKLLEQNPARPDYNAALARIKSGMPANLEL
ncbi:unnamed protein product [Chrysoparadoxa australica]